MEIEFQGRYDRAAVYKAVAIANRPSRTNAFIRFGLLSVALILFVAYFVSAAAEGRTFASDLSRSLRYLIALPFMVYFLLLPYIRSLTTGYKIWKIPMIRLPIHGYVSDQGVVFVYASNRQDEVVWKDVIRKRLTDDMIVLVSVGGVLSFIPRSFFKCDEDYKKAGEVIEFNVVEAK